MERLTERAMTGFQCNSRTCMLSYCDRECSHYQGIMNKLADYENAEENGLLLRLPCKAKDIVYITNHSFSRRKNMPFKCEVDEFVIENNGCYAVLNGCENFYAMRRFKAVNVSEFGRTVFKTEEEAQTVLDFILAQEGEA